MPPSLTTPEYWIESYRPSAEDLEVLYERLFDTMQPMEIESLAALIVQHRVEQALSARRSRRRVEGTPYRPGDRYEKGQRLVFAALDGAEGKVEAVRPGDNPAYGSYEVIEVRIGDGLRGFAAALSWPHPAGEAEEELSTDLLVERYAPVIAPQLAARLSKDEDWLAYGDRWIPRSLLPKVNPGHVNLAEAIILLADEPLPADQLLREIDLDDSVPEATRAMALDLALSADSRFRNVGALESPLWTLIAS